MVKLFLTITERFLTRQLVETSTFDKSTDHGNDVMVVKFVCLFLANEIFPKASTVRDVKTVLL